MKKTALFFALWLIASVAGGAAAPGIPVTVPCERFSEVSCTSTNPGLAIDVAQLAGETRDELAPLLKLGPKWRYPVHVRILTKDDPLVATLPDRAVATTTNGKTLKTEVVISDTDPDAREFVQRQLVISLLWEKYFTTDQSFSVDTELQVAPLWLVEGLREWLNDDPEHDRAGVVRRAAANGRAPTLAEVTSWKELSDDRLLGAWQRAFSYYLFSSLVLKPERRADFQQWLATVSSPHPTSTEQLFPTEMAWQHELVNATERSRDIVYSWDETVAELAAAGSIVLPSPDKTGADARICTIDNVAAFPPDKSFNEALNKKLFDLTALELRAHPTWRPIIALYRFGLTALIANKPEEAKKFIAQAQQQRALEMETHGQMVDYLNWFEVTHDFGGTSSHFRTYFLTARKLEDAQADPAHPNPFRTSILHVESEL